jgi:hypothetical protein
VAGLWFERWPFRIKNRQHYTRKPAVGSVRGCLVSRTRYLVGLKGVNWFSVPRTVIRGDTCLAINKKGNNRLTQTLRIAKRAQRNAQTDSLVIRLKEERCTFVNCSMLHCS